MYIFSYMYVHCVAVCGNVGMVGKRIPLTTLWLGVVKGIQSVDTVRLGRLLCVAVGVLPTLCYM